MRIYGRLDWGRLARIHLLDDRQYRDVQACPQPGPRRLEHRALKDCPELLDPKRTLLGAEQERWLAARLGRSTRPWNLLAQQTLMARFVWTDPARTAAAPTGPTAGTATPAARKRLLGTVAERKVPGVVVLGGDVHAHYVADLKADFDDPKSPVIASEFCGTSISSLALAQARVDAARAFNPHLHYAPQRPARLRAASRSTRRQLQAQLRGRRRRARSGERHRDRGALRRRGGAARRGRGLIAA